MAQRSPGTAASSPSGLWLWSSASLPRASPLNSEGLTWTLPKRFRWRHWRPARRCWWPLSCAGGPDGNGSEEGDRRQKRRSRGVYERRFSQLQCIRDELDGEGGVIKIAGPLGKKENGHLQICSAGGSTICEEGMYARHCAH